MEGDDQVQVLWHNSGPLRADPSKVVEQEASARHALQWQLTACDLPNVLK